MLQQAAEKLGLTARAFDRVAFRISVRQSGKRCLERIGRAELRFQRPQLGDAESRQQQRDVLARAGGGEGLRTDPDPAEPFCGLVFKVLP